MTSNLRFLFTVPVLVLALLMATPGAGWSQESIEVLVLPNAEEKNLSVMGTDEIIPDEVIELSPVEVGDGVQIPNSDIRPKAAWEAWISVPAGYMKSYYIYLYSGYNYVRATLYWRRGDPDLYYRHGLPPTTYYWAARSINPAGYDEQILIYYPYSGYKYFGVYAYGYSSASAYLYVEAW